MKMNTSRIPIFAILAALGLTALAGVAVFAQGPLGRHARPGQAIRKLHLTADQKAKIKPILKQAKAERGAIRADATLAKDQKKEKLRELAKKTREQIDPILTPEQKKQWEEAREKARKRRDGRSAAKL